MYCSEASITIAADDSLKYFHFSEKIRLDISCELSAEQMIHMKCQVLFSLKKKKKKKKMTSTTTLLCT